MAELEGQITMLGQLLRVRLAYRAIFDVNIIDSKIIAATQKLDDHHGRFLGFFTRRPTGKPCFLLFIRSREDGPYDYAFGFYINTQLWKVPNSERAKFVSKFASEPQVGIVKIFCQLAEPLFPAALLYGIERSIGLYLATRFKKMTTIQLSNVISFLSSNRDVELPACNIVIDEAAKTLWNGMQAYGMICVTFNCHGTASIPKNFDVIRLQYKGHYYYGVHYPNDNLLMVLVCHQALMRNEADVTDFKSSICRGLGGDNLMKICPTRFKSTKFVKCTDRLILDGCARLRSFPMLVIEDTDVLSLVRGEGMDRLPKFGFGQPAPTSPMAVFDDEPVVTGQLLQEIGSSHRSMTSTMSVGGPMDVPEVEIYPIEQLRSHVREASNHSQSTEVYSYFGGESPRPVNDPDGRILQDPEFILGWLKQCLRGCNSNHKVRAELWPAKSFESLGELRKTSIGSIDFCVVPLFTPDVLVLIVIDTKNKQWAYMNSVKVAYQEIYQYIKLALVDFKDFQGIQVSMSDWFHVDYPLMHLFIGLIHLYEKVFRYVQKLPNILTYTERDLRGLGYWLCKEQQISSQLQNLRTGKIDGSGQLREGALITFASPIQYVEASVVRVNQCPFCPKRPKKYLGNHIRLQHGGVGSFLRGLQGS